MRPVSVCVVRAVLAASLLLVAAWAQAQVPATMNYQVMLTDDADQPLADQAVTMVFTVFDSESGGTALWTETQNPTTNSIGVVSILMGDVNPIDIAFDTPMWLEVEVDGETLYPRRAIVGAPYALTDEAGGAGDGHSLDSDNGSFVDVVYIDSAGDVGVGTTTPEQQLHVTSAVQIGSVGQDGFLRVHDGDADGGGAYLLGGGEWGGRLEIYPPGGGDQTVGLGPSRQPGGGAWLWLARNDSGDSGFTIAANYNDTQEPLMHMSGSTQTATIDLSVSGDDAVVLPESTISSAETGDEPGVANAQSSAGASLEWYVPVSLTSQTITVPGDGFVFAMSTSEVKFQIDNTYHAPLVRVGVSETDGVLAPFALNVQIELPNGLPFGFYRSSAAAQRLLPVTAGSHTFYVVAALIQDGSAEVSSKLTLMYFPTAYGPVDLDR